MHYLGDMGNYIYADCEECKHTNKILKELCIKRDSKKPEYDLAQIIKCEECGTETNMIIQRPKLKKSFFQSVKEGFNDIEKHQKNITEMKANEASEPIKCPKCGSTQITANKKGFSVGNALAGDIVAGPVAGLVTGSMGKNKIEITCLKCGHSWKAGKK